MTKKNLIAKELKMGNDAREEARQKRAFINFHGQEAGFWDFIKIGLYLGVSVVLVQSIVSGVKSLFKSLAEEGEKRNQKINHSNTHNVEDFPRRDVG